MTFKNSLLLAPGFLSTNICLNKIYYAKYLDDAFLRLEKIRTLNSLCLTVKNLNAVIPVKSNQINNKKNRSIAEWYGCSKCGVLDTKVECLCCHKIEAVENVKIIGYNIQM